MVTRVLALIFTMTSSLAAAGRPTCVEGLEDDCAFLAVAESYQESPTAEARRKLRRLARRGHVGAQALLLEESDPSGTAASDTAGFKKLANMGVAAGFEGWGLLLLDKGEATEERGVDLLFQAVRRGPKDAMATLALGALDHEETSGVDDKLAESILVASCVMGSELACHRAASDRWEPQSPGHQPELAMWLAERAVALGSEPDPRNLLGLMLLSGEPGEAELERALSLLLPLAEAGDGYAMYRTARALATRGYEGDVERAVHWLDAAITAGHADAAETTLMIAMDAMPGIPAEAVSVDTTDRALALLKRERPEVYVLLLGLSLDGGVTEEGPPEARVDVDALTVAIEAAHSGRLEALQVLASLVEREPNAVEDRAALLASVKGSLCTLGPAGVPAYVYLLRMIGDPSDVLTQAAWLLLVPGQEPWSGERSDLFVTVRDQVWAELSGAQLVTAEARTVQLREELRSTHPRCALVR